MKLANLFTQNARLRLFAFITLAAAAIISFTSLRDLGVYAGFGERAWLLPMCVDAVAALGMEVWLSGSPAWKAGRNLAMTAIGGSLAGNGGDWWLKSASYQSAGLGLVPPAALAAVLIVLHRHWNRTGHVVIRKAASSPTPAADRPAVTATQKTVTKSQPATRRVPESPAAPVKSSDMDKVRQLVEYAAQHGSLPTRREAQAVLRQLNGVGVGTNKATALLALAKDEVAAPPEPVQLHTVRTESNPASATEEAAL